ncbi:hypothetical protein [Rhizobium lusitanum]|uniref:hypothetical protein n=1 Tax=Rhizobium lusitanum TaxID=293958 RepID=UPI0019584DBA|nr:hypothetical protein [Rhizobium lusitanum]MBM7048401.1 hypothetical protein [Rhizobium lusitanum]
MTALRTFRPTDRVLACLLAVLTAATVLMATEAHAFCSIFCIHGDRMIETEICASRR